MNDATYAEIVTAALREVGERARVAERHNQPWAVTITLDLDPKVALAAVNIGRQAAGREQMESVDELLRYNVAKAKEAGRPDKVAWLVQWARVHGYEVDQ